MNFSSDSFRTPFGMFSLAVDDTGAVAATAFGGPAELGQRLGGAIPIPDAERTRTAREQVLDYCEGKRRHFALSLAPCGTDFQLRVWAALAGIPFGATRSYGEIALLVGRPGAARAVGRANATNPICLIVPCHRVIGADGSLTGFAFGEQIKRRLLVHEQTVARRSCLSAAA